MMPYYEGRYLHNLFHITAHMIWVIQQQHLELFHDSANEQLKVALFL